MGSVINGRIKKLYVKSYVSFRDNEKTVIFLTVADAGLSNELCVAHLIFVEKQLCVNIIALMTF